MKNLNAVNIHWEPLLDFFLISVYYCHQLMKARNFFDDMVFCQIIVSLIIKIFHFIFLIKGFANGEKGAAKSYHSLFKFPYKFRNIMFLDLPSSKSTIKTGEDITITNLVKMFIVIP